MRRYLFGRLSLQAPAGSQSGRSRQVCGSHLKDNVKASILQADGTYTKPDKRGKMLVNSQEYFCREATERAEKPKEQENSRVFVPAEPVE